METLNLNFLPHSRGSKDMSIGGNIIKMFSAFRTGKMSGHWMPVWDTWIKGKYGSAVDYGLWMPEPITCTTPCKDLPALLLQFWLPVWIFRWQPSFFVYRHYIYYTVLAFCLYIRSCRSRMLPGNMIGNDRCGNKLLLWTIPTQQHLRIGPPWLRSNTLRQPFCLMKHEIAYRNGNLLLLHHRPLFWLLHYPNHPLLILLQMFWKWISSSIHSRRRIRLRLLVLLWIEVVLHHQKYWSRVNFDGRLLPWKRLLLLMMMMIKWWIHL